MRTNSIHRIHKEYTVSARGVLAFDCGVRGNSAPFSLVLPKAEPPGLGPVSCAFLGCVASSLALSGARLGCVASEPLALRAPPLLGEEAASVENSARPGIPGGERKAQPAVLCGTIGGGIAVAAFCREGSGLLGPFRGAAVATAERKMPSPFRPPKSAMPLAARKASAVADLAERVEPLSFIAPYSC